MGVIIKIKWLLVDKKVRGAWDKSLPKTTNEILEDCNEYAKYRDGTLVESSQTHTEFDKGKLVWKTPYAKRQYWKIETAIKEKHPNATWRWCEAAKSEHLEEWKAKAQKEFENNL